VAGLIDESPGKPIGGTEIVHLVGHKGRLYAGNGYWKDSRGFGSISWAQVLVSESPKAGWRVDLALGPPHLRVTALKSVTFTTDATGQTLASPVNLLLAASDVLTLGKLVSSIWTRDDEEDVWVKTTIAADPELRRCTRAILVHRDSETGVDRVFAALGQPGVYSGVYDPRRPGKIRWDEEAELGPVAIRPMSLAEANSSLYASAGASLYRRIDGRVPRWQEAYSDDTREHWDLGGIRGLTAVSSPVGSGESLLFSHTDRIIRVDPSDGHRATVELRVRPLLARSWGSDVPGGIIAAYNDMMPLNDPATGRTVHIMGVQGQVERGGKDGDHRPDTYGGWYAGGSYLIRETDRSYRLKEVNGRWKPGKPKLVAPRAFAVSPFPEDSGQQVYFGGFDCNFVPACDTAWIFRASIETVLGGASSEKRTLASIARDWDWAGGEAYFREKLVELGRSKGMPKSKTLDSLMMPYQICRIMSLASVSGRGRGDAFAQWLVVHQPLVEELALSLDEQDNAEAAVGVLRRLHHAHGDAVATYRNLAVAYAVVWDQRKAKKGELESAFGYYMRNSKAMAFAPDRLSVPWAKRLADARASTTDREWALKQHKGERNPLELWREFAFDQEAFFNGAKKEIEGKPYTLANLKRYGGDPWDRNHYTVECAKALGIPCALSSFRVASGGNQSMVAFVQGDWRRAKWEFAWDRDATQRMLVVSSRDPQTGKVVTEHDLTMEAASYGLKPRTRRYAAELLMLGRIMIQEGDAERSAELTLKSLETNGYQKETWLVFVHLAVNDVVPEPEVDKALNRILGHAQEWPDLSLEVLLKLLERIPDTKSKRRLSIYGRAAKLYPQRTDLVSQLCIAKADYLLDLGNRKEAIKTYESTLLKYFDDGPIALEALDRLAAMLKEDERLDQAVKLHQEVLKRIPKPRKSIVVKYTVYVKVGQRLIDLLKETGRDAEAVALKRKLDSLAPDRK